jgi:hypothetical protein
VWTINRALRNRDEANTAERLPSDWPGAFMNPVTKTRVRVPNGSAGEARPIVTTRLGVVGNEPLNVPGDGWVKKYSSAVMIRKVCKPGVGVGV